MDVKNCLKWGAIIGVPLGALGSVTAIAFGCRFDIYAVLGTCAWGFILTFLLLLAACGFDSLYRKMHNGKDLPPILKLP